MARWPALKEMPFGRYYGSVDATPLFIMLAGAYLERTGERCGPARAVAGRSRRLSARSYAWGDRDGDGFVEYGRQAGDGLVNQGWKDSHDAVFHADGRLAHGPIALVEVQAYAYGAWRAAAMIARPALKRRPEESGQLQPPCCQPPPSLRSHVLGSTRSES